MRKLQQILNKRGFTLIEVLIVVLIIGILAAIALPQYQMARDKAKYVNMIGVVKSLKEANERYYLINQKYSADIDTLDINLSYNSDDKNETSTHLYFDWGDCYLMDTSYVYCKLSFPIVEYVAYYDKYSGKTMCYARTDQIRAEKLCEILTGKTEPESATATWTRYLF